MASHVNIGALVRTSVRRIKLAMPSAFAYQARLRRTHGLTNQKAQQKIIPGQPAEPLFPRGLGKVALQSFNLQPAIFPAALPIRRTANIRAGMRNPG
jgi:hypothetical protein